MARKECLECDGKGYCLACDGIGYIEKVTTEELIEELKKRTNVLYFDTTKEQQ